MAEVKRPVYVETWAALLALLAVNVAVALNGLRYGAWINLGIAAVQASLLVSVFMRLGRTGAALRLTAAAGLLWLVLLYGLAEGDYATRHWDEALGRMETLKLPEGGK